MGSMSRNSKRNIVARERRATALSLRKAGCTFEKIGQQIGVTTSAAYKMVAKSLQALAEQEKGDTRALKQLELARLDTMLVAIYQAAAGGSETAIDRVLKISERRARLLGLDAPQQMEHQLAQRLNEELSMALNVLEKGLDPSTFKRVATILAEAIGGG